MGIGLIVVFAIAGVIVFVWDLSLKVKDKVIPEEKLPYKKKKYFFSIAERKFYEVLKEVAAEQNLVLFSKVRLADIVYVPKDQHWRRYWNKIQSKHVDFLLCEPKNYEPVCAIELDDSSHEREDRVIRDAFIEKVYEIAGLQLVRVVAKAGYDKEALRDIIC